MNAEEKRFAVLCSLTCGTIYLAGFLYAVVAW